VWEYVSKHKKVTRSFDICKIRKILRLADQFRFFCLPSDFSLFKYCDWAWDFLINFCLLRALSATKSLAEKSLDHGHTKVLLTLKERKLLLLFTDHKCLFWFFSYLFYFFVFLFISRKPAFVTFFDLSLNAT